MRKILLPAALIIINISACKTSKETKNTEAVVVKPMLDCTTTGLTFADIKPILDKHCISCHGYDGADGLNFLSSADVKKAASKGELLGTIKWQRGFPHMPAQAAQLDQASIDMIECWIKNGMKD